MTEIESLQNRIRVIHKRKTERELLKDFVSAEYYQQIIDKLRSKIKYLSNNQKQNK